MDVKCREPRPNSRGWTVAATVLILGFLAALILPGCGAAGTGAGKGVINVVAGENFWGSIAAQLGGSLVKVTSIENNPNTDPHAYESNTNNARAFASAGYVILNGAGYDTWGQKLLNANPVPGRKVLMISDLLGKHEGDNPHFWYNPAYVSEVADRITADYIKLKPAAAGRFTALRSDFEHSLKSYKDRINYIKSHFANQKVGSTESIFVYMAGALDLDLVSPPAFMQAISEGNEPPANAVAQFQRQIRQKQINVLVYNRQTSTNITENLKQLAVSEGIPVIGISETMTPAGTTFQDWQDSQLVKLQNALESGRRAG